MKSVLVGMMLVSVFIVPAKAGGGGYSGVSGGGSGPAPSVSSTATGGAGGTGGSAAGGSATGGSATGGQSNASGNASSISVSLTTDNSSGTGSGSANGAASDPGAANVRYDGSYTVRSAPAIVAPSLTSTFSDTCMGSASFGLSFVGFGATGGATMVDEACVRRLDSREFRAMGLNDVALALLCQSAANRAAVEATGRACPSAPAKGDTASVAPTITMSKAADRSTVAPVEQKAAPVTLMATPQTSRPINVANTEAKPMEVLPADPVEVKPIPDELSESKGWQQWQQWQQ